MPFPIALPPVQDWTFKPSLDIRERFERRLDKDFNSSNNDNRNDLFERWRVGGTFQINKTTTFRGMYQFDYDAFWTSAKNGGIENSDLYEGWLNFKLGKGDLRVGRQEFIKGDKRFFDQGDWGNAGRAWDMVRYTDSTWDLWAGRLGLNSAPNKNTKLAGLSYNSRFGQSMAFYKHDEKSGLKDDIYTLDHRWTRKSKKLSGEFEVAGQIGQASNAPHRAFAGEARIVYQTSPKLSVYAEGDIASGGHQGKFDQMYPGNHSKYGIMDIQGWRNLKGLTTGTTYQASKTQTVTLEYSRFGLFSTSDAWYGDNGKANKGSNFTFVDPTGAKGGDVGQEIDLSTCIKLSGQATLDGGIGVFLPGHFVDAFANTGDRHQVWGYIQYRIKF